MSPSRLLRRLGLPEPIPMSAMEVVEGLSRFHDADAGVTCWSNGKGLSCLRTP